MVRSAAIGMGLLLASAVAWQADAATMFSFSNVAMTDWPAGSAPPFILSGSFTVPELNPGALTDTGWSIGLTSVDLRVTRDGTTVAQFTDPKQLEYASGVGADGAYWIDVETPIPASRFLGFSIRDLGLVSADFVYTWCGYSFEAFPSGTPDPVVETAVDEPGSFTLLAGGIVGCAAFARRKRSRSA
jgi:hypothetical protein